MRVRFREDAEHACQSGAERRSAMGIRLLSAASRVPMKLPPDAVRDDAQPGDHHADETNDVGQLLLGIKASVGVGVVVDRGQVDHEVQPEADGHDGDADDHETGQVGVGPAPCHGLYN